MDYFILDENQRHSLFKKSQNKLFKMKYLSTVIKDVS